MQTNQHGSRKNIININGADYEVEVPIDFISIDKSGGKFSKEYFDHIVSPKLWADVTRAVFIAAAVAVTGSVIRRH